MIKDVTIKINREGFFDQYFSLLPAELKMLIYKHANEDIWKKPENKYNDTDVLRYKMHIQQKITDNIPKGLCHIDYHPNPLGPLIVTHKRWCKKHRCYVYNYNYGRWGCYKGEAKEHEVEKTRLRYLNNKDGTFIIQ